MTGQDPTIGEALDLLAERDPEAPAVRDGHEALDRAALRSRSRRLARLLIDAGVREGDLVTVRGGNTVAFVVAVCAVHRSGGTPQPMNPRLPAEEQRAIVDLVQPAAVLGADPGEFPGWRTLPLAPPLDGIDDGPLPSLAAPSWKAPTTSGSTGRPKAVLSTAPARADPDRQVVPFLPLAARQLVAGPLAHSAPFTYAFRGLTTGHALVLLPRFDPAAVLTAIGEHRITWVLLVPTMLHRILRAPEALAAADLSSLEQVVHLGSPISADLKRHWLALLGPQRLTEVYAGTESNGLAVIRGDEWLAHPGSVGRAAPGTEIRVVDERGEPVPAGVTGRVQLRRTTGAAYRYLGAATPLPGAWDGLGDDGRLDADGYLHLEDRGADRITRAGTSLYPAEVERVLERHAAVRSAVAVGVRDDDLGQRVHAVADVDRPVTADELQRWANRRLDPEKRIDALEVVHDPVRDDAGKVRRREWARALGRSAGVGDGGAGAAPRGGESARPSCSTRPSSSPDAAPRPPCHAGAMTLIAEDLLLLLLDDDSGTLPALWTDVQVPLGAAVLAELRLAGAVRAGEPPREDGMPLLPTEPWPSPRVLPEEGARVDDPVLADALATIRERSRTADDLAFVLGDGLLERLTDRLVDDGVLERHETRVLGIIPRTSWPAVRTEGEARVRDELRAALVDGRDPDDRTAAIAALLQALDRVPRTLGLHGAEARTARDRATALAEDDWPSRTVRDAIAETATATTLGGAQPGTLLAP